MAEITVNVERGSDGMLTITPDHVTIYDDYWVLWKFPDDLAADQFGFIFFQPSLGPFHSLRSYSNKEVIGKGNVGGAQAPTPYPYTAMILQAGKPLVASGTAVVFNEAATKDTSPDIYVTYDSASKKITSVSPETVKLNLGDTATWFFQGLTEGIFADFLFTDPLLYSATGPFAAFYACKSDSLVPFRASGTNFAQGELSLIKKFGYTIEIRDAQGNFITSHEPDIDNLGPPPG